MSPQLRMWVEVSFNLAYLAVVWALVALMVARRDRPAPAERLAAGRFRLAFALLALGDTGHVGFRVAAYALGDLDSTVAGLGLVGLGALATAITVTFFYVALLGVWQARAGRALGWPGRLVIAAGAVRLLLFLLPGNDWSASVPPQPFSLYRNAPLVVQGVVVAWLLLHEGARTGDALARRLGLCVVVSFAFYAPVILFVQRVPAIGMLMIPKTLAYLAMAWFGFRTFFSVRGSPP